MEILEPHSVYGFRNLRTATSEQLVMWTMCWEFPFFAPFGADSLAISRHPSWTNMLDMSTLWGSDFCTDVLKANNWRVSASSENIIILSFFLWSSFLWDGFLVLEGRGSNFRFHEIIWNEYKEISNVYIIQAWAKLNIHIHRVLLSLSLSFFLFLCLSVLSDVINK